MSRQKQTQKQVLVTEQQKQNDVIIKSICKKIRNLTKKISDIQGLAKRADLKPEQLEKIKNKPTIVEQRRSYQEFLKFYKTILTENAAENKNQINPDFQRISNLVTLSHFVRSTGDSFNLSQQEINSLNVLNGVTTKNNQTLTQRAQTTANIIKNYIDNADLVNKVDQLFANEENSIRRFVVENKTTEVIAAKVTPVVQVKVPQVKTETPREVPVEIRRQPEVVEQIAVVESQVVQTPVTINTPVVQESQHQTPVVEQSPVQVKTEEPVQQVTQPVSTTEVPQGENVVKTETKQGENNEKREKPYYKKPYKQTYRQREEGYNKGREDKRVGEYKPRKNYENRPKYNEKKEDRRDDTSLSSSEQREYRRREFNKNEIKQLENDGFIVLQKKQKPKEQEQYHRKQHGYKDKTTHYNDKK